MPNDTVASRVAGLSSGVDGDEAEAVSNGDSCDSCDDIRLWWDMVTAGSFSSKKPNSPTLSGTRRVEGVEGVEGRR